MTDKEQRKYIKQVFESGLRNGLRTVHGFMCKVDWDHELGCALGGNTIYSDIADLKEHRKCVQSECGIVEVEIRLKRVVKRDNFRFSKRSKKSLVVSDHLNEKAANGTT